LEVQAKIVICDCEKNEKWEWVDFIQLSPILSLHTMRGQSYNEQYCGEAPLPADRCTLKGWRKFSQLFSDRSNQSLWPWTLSPLNTRTPPNSKINNETKSKYMVRFYEELSELLGIVVSSTTRKKGPVNTCTMHTHTHLLLPTSLTQAVRENAVRCRWVDVEFQMCWNFLEIRAECSEVSSKLLWHALSQERRKTERWLWRWWPDDGLEWALQSGSDTHLWSSAAKHKIFVLEIPISPCSTSFSLILIPSKLIQKVRVGKWVR
jgi:hypothetical protein